MGKVYCSSCWDSWLRGWSRSGLDSALAKSASTPSLPKTKCKAGSGDHFDFIEVGTSDWGTVTQFCASDERNASWIAKEMQLHVPLPAEARGIAVEMIGEHLRKLPSLPGLEKVEAAMDEMGGTSSAWFVLPDTAENNIGQYHAVIGAHSDYGPHEVDVMWYAKSLSRLGEPHVELQEMLRDVGRLDLLQQRHVRVLSWADLCTEFGVGSVDVLQLDCEGKDCAILRGLISYCRQHPSCFPRLIGFEVNHLTPTLEVESTVRALRAVGYKVRQWGYQNCLVERRGSTSRRSSAQVRSFRTRRKRKYIGGD